MATPAGPVGHTVGPVNAASHRGFHYDWVVVAAAFLVGALNSTFMWAFTFVLVPISEQFGWARGEISFAYTLQYLIFALGSIGGGWLVDRVGARVTLVGGSILLIVSMVLTTTVTELWQLYLYFGVLLGVSRSAFIAPLHTVVGIWFRRRLGLAMGIVSAAIGIGPFVFAPIMRWMIEQTSWQATLGILGVACGLAMTGASLLIRNRPADLNLLPYGETGTTGSVSKPPVQPGLFYDGTQTDFMAHAKTTQPFYLLIGIHFLGCLSHSVLLAQLAPMIAGNGAAPALTGITIALVSGFSVLGYFAFSMLADKRDGRSALMATFALQATGILLMLWAREGWQFGVFALLFGIGMGGEMVVFPIINRQYYGNAPVGTLYGLQMFGAGIGMGGGGLLGGVLFDAVGNYTLALYLAAGAALLGILLIAFLIYPVAKRRVVLAKGAV